jgi:hypothetical protein
MSDLLISALWFSLSVSLVCSAVIIYFAARKRSLVWVGYSVVSLLMVAPVIMTFVPTAYGTAKLLGDMILVACIVLFAAASCIAFSRHIFCFGYGGLVSFFLHVFLLKNFP